MVVIGLSRSAVPSLRSRRPARPWPQSLRVLLRPARLTFQERAPHGIASCAQTVSAVAGPVGAVDRRGGLRSARHSSGACPASLRVGARIGVGVGVQGISRMGPVAETKAPEPSKRSRVDPAELNTGSTRLRVGYPGPTSGNAEGLGSTRCWFSANHQIDPPARGGWPTSGNVESLESTRLRAGSLSPRPRQGTDRHHTRGGIFEKQAAKKSPPLAVAAQPGQCGTLRTS
jgi:hypothetical protein